MFDRWIIFIRNYFSVGRREARGIILLMILCLLFLFLPLFYPDHKPDPGKTANLDSLYLLLKQKLAKREKEGFSEKRPVKYNWFPFDPNVLDRDGFLKMNLKPSLVNTLLNYRSRGGSFRVKKDILKIYGIDTELYERMKMYIQLPDSLVARKYPEKLAKRKVWEARDLNLADTTDLKKVYGIGSVLASRIIRYRDLLGAYVEMEQLHEVYGLQDSIISSIKEKFFIKDPHPSRLNINELQAKELRRHPYISASLARLIVAYREAHGTFRSDSSLLQIHAVSDSIHQKLKPYIIF